MKAILYTLALVALVGCGTDPKNQAPAASPETKPEQTAPEKTNAVDEHDDHDHEAPKLVGEPLPSATFAAELRAAGVNPDKICFQWTSHPHGDHSHDYLEISDGPCAKPAAIAAEPRLTLEVGAGKPAAQGEVVHKLYGEGGVVGQMTHFKGTNSVVQSLTGDALAQVKSLYGEKKPIKK